MLFLFSLNFLENCAGLLVTNRSFFFFFIENDSSKDSFTKDRTLGGFLHHLKGIYCLVSMVFKETSVFTYIIVLLYLMSFSGSFIFAFL